MIIYCPDCGEHNVVGTNKPDVLDCSLMFRCPKCGLFWEVIYRSLTHVEYEDLQKLKDSQEARG